MTVETTVRNAKKSTTRTRIYVTIPDIPTDEIKALADAIGAPTVHTKVGDYPELDQAWRRHNRQEVVEMKAAIVEAGFADLNVKFSRKAGCSCGCSPGFIVSNDHGRNIRITKK